MKKLIILLLIAFLVIPAEAQRGGKEHHDTLFWTSVSKDTTVFRSFKREHPYVEVDIGTFEENDSIWVGESADKSFIGLIPIGSTTVFPLKVVKASWQSTVNGHHRYRIPIEGDSWNAQWIGIRVKYATTCPKPSIHWTE